MTRITITRDDKGASGTYWAHVEGHSEQGRLTWVDNGGVRIAEHTIVPPAIGGMGVAARLVDALVADAREKGFRIVPACSYVAAKFDRHPEWADLRA